MTAIFLALAIATEVIATLALKASEGFSRPVPAAIVVVGYGISFFLLALVLKHFSVGTTYAIWSAVGTAAIALAGIALYGETANALKIASLGLNLAKAAGRSPPHLPPSEGARASHSYGPSQRTSRARAPMAPCD